MVLRNLEIYENNPDSINGINKFFNAYAIAKVFLHVHKNRHLDISEMQKINLLIQKYKSVQSQDNKNKLFIFIKKVIDLKFVEVQKFLDLKIIKESTYIPDVDYSVDRTKILGCVGTVVEM